MTPFRPRWLPGALVAAATFAVFLPALGGGFVNWDDDENFLWNPHYRGLGWRQIRWMFTAVHQGLYIPVTWLTLGLDHVVWGMNPFGYHLTSVALHAANAALFYAVASRLLGAAFPGRTEGRSLGAAAAALVFSVHPLRVESVAWVTERRDVVVGLLGLLTVLAYLAAWRRGAEGRLAWGWYGAAVLCFGLALLAKSIVVCLPLVLLALDLYPLSRSAPLARLALEKLPFLALSAGIAALTVAILVDRDLLASRETLGVAARLALAAYGLAFYAGKTLVPGPLSPIYPLIQPVTPWTLTYLAPAAVVILVTAGVILARRRWPAGCVIWGSYVALVAPVLGLLHSGPQIAADRYSYLACMPFALLAGAGLTWVRRRAAERQIAPLVGWAALAGAGGIPRRPVGAYHGPGQGLAGLCHALGARDGRPARERYSRLLPRLGPRRRRASRRGAGSLHEIPRARPREPPRAPGPAPRAQRNHRGPRRAVGGEPRRLRSRARPRSATSRRAREARERDGDAG